MVDIVVNGKAYESEFNSIIDNHVSPSKDEWSVSEGVTQSPNFKVGSAFEQISNAQKEGSVTSGMPLQASTELAGEVSDDPWYPPTWAATNYKYDRSGVTNEGFKVGKNYIDEVDPKAAERALKQLPKPPKGLDVSPFLDHLEQYEPSKNVDDRTAKNLQQYKRLVEGMDAEGYSQIPQYKAFMKRIPPSDIEYNLDTRKAKLPLPKPKPKI